MTWHLSCLPSHSRNILRLICMTRRHRLWIEKWWKSPSPWRKFPWFFTFRFEISISSELIYETRRIRFCSADRVSYSESTSFCGGSSLHPESNYIILKGIKGWKLDPSDTYVSLGFYGGKGTKNMNVNNRGTIVAALWILRRRVPRLLPRRSVWCAGSLSLSLYVSRSDDQSTFCKLSRRHLQGKM